MTSVTPHATIRSFEGGAAATKGGRARAEHITSAGVAGQRVPFRTREANLSEDPRNGASTIHASKGDGGGAGKWLLGAAAAVVIAGGAYAAYKTLGPGQNDSAEMAYTQEYDPYEDAAVRAGPLEPSDDVMAETASADEEVSEPAPVRRAARERAPVQEAAVPEETIGITPVNATTEDVNGVQDSDEVIVRAPQRPIWDRTPSARRLSALYPERALQRGDEGEARLSCTVLEGGSLDCMRVEETSRGFGTAAMRVARTLRHAPQRADGTDATGTPVNLRVVFRIDDDRGRRYAAR